MACDTDGSFRQHIEVPGVWLKRGRIAACDWRLMDSPLVCAPGVKPAMALQTGLAGVAWAFLATAVATSSDRFDVTVWLVRQSMPAIFFLRSNPVPHCTWQLHLLPTNGVKRRKAA